MCHLSWQSHHWPTTGRTSIRNPVRSLIASALGLDDLNYLRNHIAGALHHHPITYAHILAVDLILIV